MRDYSPLHYKVSQTRYEQTGTAAKIAISKCEKSSVIDWYLSYYLTTKVVVRTIPIATPSGTAS